MAHPQRLLVPLFAFASAFCLAACEDSVPAEPAPAEPAPVAEPAPPTYSIHEWGFIAHHYADQGSRLRATTFPPTAPVSPVTQEELLELLGAEGGEGTQGLGTPLR